MQFLKTRRLEIHGVFVYQKRTITTTETGVNTGRWVGYGRTKMGRKHLTKTTGE